MSLHHCHNLQIKSIEGESLGHRRMCHKELRAVGRCVIISSDALGSSLVVLKGQSSSLVQRRQSIAAQPDPESGWAILPQARAIQMFWTIVPICLQRMIEGIMGVVAQNIGKCWVVEGLGCKPFSQGPPSVQELLPRSLCSSSLTFLEVPQQNNTICSQSVTAQFGPWSLCGRPFKSLTNIPGSTDPD